MVLVDGLPLEGAFWGGYRTRAYEQRAHAQLIEQQREQQRRTLDRAVGPMRRPIFRHRSR